MENEFLQLMFTHPQTTFRTLEITSDEATALSAFDWTKVLEFRGFICKVKHNDLWDALPQTRAFLVHSNLEFIAFSHYAPVFERLRSSGRSSRDDKIVAFTDFLLNEFKDGSRATLCLLRNMVLHDRVIWELRNAQKTQPDVRSDFAPSRVLTSGELLLAVVPVRRGVFRIVRCDINPFDVTAALKTKSPDIGALDIRSRWLCYWLAGEQLSVLELDDASAAILAQIDDKSRVGDILEELSRALGCTVNDLSGSREFFCDAFARGMLIPTEF
jgi:hypothetical protein